MILARLERKPVVHFHPIAELVDKVASRPDNAAPGSRLGGFEETLDRLRLQQIVIVERQDVIRTTPLAQILAGARHPQPNAEVHGQARVPDPLDQF